MNREAPVVGRQYYVPGSGHIQCTSAEEVNGQPVWFFIRCHSYYNGERLKFRPDEWDKAQWEAVVGQYQLL